MKNFKLKNFMVTATVLATIGGTHAFAVSGKYEFDLPAGYAIDITKTKTSMADEIAWELYAVCPDQYYFPDTYKYVVVSAYTGSYLLMPETQTEEGTGLYNYYYYPPVNLATDDPITFRVQGNNIALGAIASMFFDWY